METFEITLGSELISSLVPQEFLLGDNTELKAGMEFSLQITENKSVEEKKKGDKLDYFTYACGGRRYKFNIYNVGCMFDADGSNPFIKALESGVDHKLASSFEIAEVLERKGYNDKPLYALSSYTGYEIIVKGRDIADVSFAEKQSIRETSLKPNAKPLKAVRLKDSILVPKV
jgi:hypothetical protein